MRTLYNMVIDKTAQGRRTFPPGAQRGRTRRPDAMKRMTSPAERRMVPETSRRNRTGHDAPDTPSSGRARGTLNLEVGAPAAAPSPFDPAAHVACTRSPLTVAPGAPSFGCPHTAHTSPVTRSVCQASKQAAWNRYVRGSPGNSASHSSSRIATGCPHAAHDVSPWAKPNHVRDGLWVGRRPSLMPENTSGHQGRAPADPEAIGDVVRRSPHAARDVRPWATTDHDAHWS